MNIRRKKSTLTEVKVAVVGAHGVGKTALTVRFLTKRYIGEYDHQIETRYKYEAMVDGDTVMFEILDTCPARPTDECCGSDVALCSAETAAWADGFVLVFSIIDRNSFLALSRARQQIKESRDASAWPIPSVLIGSKADMVHLRQVSTHEGEQLATELGCSYMEVAAAEQVQPTCAVFHEVCREVLALRRRGKQSLLDRMLASAKSSSKTASGGTGGPRTYLRGKSDSALP